MSASTRRRRRLAGLLSLTFVAALAGGPARAATPPLRSPQVAFADSSLRALFARVQPGIDPANAQLEAPTWPFSPAGNSDAMATCVAMPGSDEVGFYDADDPAAAPATFEVFPAYPGIGPGWFASIHISASSAMTVYLFDPIGEFEGSITYLGVHRSALGLYLRGPGGTWYSQDARNAGASPHVLAFASPGDATTRWECFEESPYAAATSRFVSMVCELQVVVPVPVRTGTWGRLKALYR